MGPEKELQEKDRKKLMIMKEQKTINLMLKELNPVI
jgi:hypothetical protein